MGRDTVPGFVEDGGEVRGVGLDFSGWDGKQRHADDAGVARAVLAKCGIPRERTWLVAEGGSFETDGAGTLLVTENSVVDDHRNRGRSRQQIGDELKRVLGVAKVIWFDGVRGEDIADAHVDSPARFVAPGVVLLDRVFPGEPADSWSRSADQARRVLKGTTDARGKKIEVIDLPQPDPESPAPAPRCSPRTSTSTSPTGPCAYRSSATPRPTTAPTGSCATTSPAVKVDAIASGGGGIHCSTHDQRGRPAE